MDWFLSLLIIDYLIWFINGEATCAEELARLAQVLPEECGESSHDRIIGGDDAALGQYPWIARIGYSIENCKDPDLYVCAGSLVTTQHVISAAHCITDVFQLNCATTPGSSGMMQMNSILLGELDIRTYIDCVGFHCAPPAQYFEIASYVYHDDYNNPRSRNDIAVIKMKTPVVFSEYIFPICLPIQLEKPKSGEWTEVAGWGLINMTTQHTADTLQRLSLQVVDNKICIDNYGADGIEISDFQICAGGVTNKDSCNGDSGGPLMMISGEEGSPRQYLAGLVSFGKSICGMVEEPAVYTNVHAYIPWILSAIQDLD